MKNNIKIFVSIILLIIIIIICNRIITANTVNINIDNAMAQGNNVEEVIKEDNMFEEKNDSKQENSGIIEQAMFKENFYDIKYISELNYVVYEQMSDEVKKENILSESEYDFNKDGNPEKISFTETTDKLVLKINNQIIDRYKKSELIVYIVDFNKEDNNVEILVKPNGWYENKIENAKIYDVSIVNKNVRVQKNEIINREYYYTNQNGKIIACINSSSNEGSTIFEHLTPVISQEYFELKDGKLKKYDYDIKNLVTNNFTASNFWYSNNYKNVEKLSRQMQSNAINIQEVCDKNQISFLETEYKFSIKGIKKLGTNIVLETESADDGTTQYIFDFGF